MFGFKKVLVGVDVVPSDDDTERFVLPTPTRSAVETAFQLAESSGAELTLFSVDCSTSSSQEEEEPTSEATGVLEALVTNASERGVKAHVKTATGRAWMAMIQEVLAEGQQLAIVGSRRHSSARRLLIGSTSGKLLRKCPCPVWIVRPDESPNVRTVLVADDLTPVGEYCLDLGVSAARLLDARLLVVHAVQYPWERQLRRTGISDEQMQADREQVCLETERALQNRLAATDYRTIHQGARIEISPGPPEVVIENKIHEHGADLLVMGTLGRGGIPGLLVGNTAERLLPAVSCSLLAVKPDGFVCPISSP